MSRVLVVGTLNLETSVRVQALPLPSSAAMYIPGGLSQRPGGVGYTIARALRGLGNEVAFAAPLADDFLGRLLREELQTVGLDDSLIQNVLSGTPQSVVLVAPDGQRQVLTDLKDMARCRYPASAFQTAVRGAELAIMTNAPFTQPFLGTVRESRIPILTDLHAIERLDNPYDEPYLAAATFLFASAERWTGAPAELARALLSRSPGQLVVLGMGERGALLLERGGQVELVPSLVVGSVLNTTGAGDVLASTFTDGILSGQSPLDALRRACQFAGRHVAGI